MDLRASGRPSVARSKRNTASWTASKPPTSNCCSDHSLHDVHVYVQRVTPTSTTTPVTQLGRQPVCDASDGRSAHVEAVRNGQTSELCQVVRDDVHAILRHTPAVCKLERHELLGRQGRRRNRLLTQRPQRVA